MGIKDSNLSLRGQMKMKGRENFFERNSNERKDAEVGIH